MNISQAVQIHRESDMQDNLTIATNGVLASDYSRSASNFYDRGLHGPKAV